MRAINISLLSLLFIITSCKECDCDTENQKTEAEMWVLTPENAFSVDQLYSISLSNRLDTIKGQINRLKDSINSSPNANLKQRLQDLDGLYSELSIEWRSHAAPPCPSPGPSPSDSCCPVFLDVTGFSGIEIEILTNNDISHVYRDNDIVVSRNRKFINFEGHKHPHKGDKTIGQHSHCPHRIKFSGLDSLKRQSKFTSIID